MTQFAEYQKLYKTVSDKDKNYDANRILHLFNIKLHLVLGIKDVVFDDNIAKVKTDEVRACYVQLIKSTEMWNVFEALFEYAKTKHPLGSKDKKERKNVIEKMTESRELHVPEVMAVLASGFNELKHLCKEKSKFKKDFQGYLERVGSHDYISSKSKTALKNIMESIEADNKEPYSDMLYLLYADRNLFYHTAEAVKMGMSYSNRLALMELLYRMLADYILAVMNNLLRQCRSGG